MCFTISLNAFVLKKVYLNKIFSQCALTILSVIYLLIIYGYYSGVSEPANMAYMTRLGLWGPGTPFASGFSDFKSAIEKGGVGMMELVAMHMKRTGSYICRTLSFEGCTFEIIEDAVEKDNLIIYDKAASFWQKLFTELHNKLDRNELIFPIKEKKSNKNDDDDIYDDDLSEDEDDLDADERPLLLVDQKKARSTVTRYFWGAHQRFFRSLCISMKVPCAIRIAEASRLEGKSVIIGLQSTGESGMEQEFAKKSKSSTVQDFISAPEVILKRLIKKVFPLPPKPMKVLIEEKNLRLQRQEELQKEKERERRDRAARYTRISQSRNAPSGDSTKAANSILRHFSKVSSSFKYRNTASRLDSLSSDSFGESDDIDDDSGIYEYEYVV
jgi:hypothetical protein